MVEIIGLTTLVAMVWLLAFAMKTESDAARRRCTSPAVMTCQEKGAGSETKHAA
jgi:hypothetical protein